MARAEWSGRHYVCLRGMNFLNKNKGGPWLHVPTAGCCYDPAEGVPKHGVFLQKALEIAAQNWPVFSHAWFVRVDQETTGKQGGVMRLALDFGKVNKLPRVLYKPGKKLDCPRHPVFWALADRVSVFDRPVMQRALRSSYALAGDWPLDMEVNDRGDAIGVVIRNMTIQQSVGDMFEKAFGRGLFVSRSFRPEKEAQLLMASSFPSKG